MEGCEDVGFTTRPSENTWSPAEEFSHTLRSAAALTSALKGGPQPLRSLPRPKREPITYAGVAEWYTRELEGLKKRNPPNPFGPREIKETDASAMRDHWNATQQKFESRLGLFEEADLNSSYIPHPLLGAMYLREMLYFTILHSMHHLRSIERKMQSIKS